MPVMRVWLGRARSQVSAVMGMSAYADECSRSYQEAVKQVTTCLVSVSGDTLGAALMQYRLRAT
jgi:hypothetical protein